jgi:para-aminobenzoate synthetase component 1
VTASPAAVAASLLAALPAEVGAAVVRRGDHLLVGAAPSRLVAADGAAALAALDGLEPGFWVGACSFELGHVLERVALRAASYDPPDVPDVVFARFDALAVVAPSGATAVRGEGPGRSLLEAATAAGAVRPAGPALGPLGAWRSSLSRHEFEVRVQTVLGLLHAGECYQVNLTRRLEADGALDPVALHAALAASHPAPHAGMLRVPAGTVAQLPEAFAVVSASPEGFLRRVGDHIETRPIKGTAPGGADGAAALRASAKDHAENVMIVDLARNDLGRVCAPGSMSVPELCAVEAHPGLHHLVSTVRGTLRADVGTGALLAATFPPASVTGAPKPRVLGIVEELEPVRRGMYCGAFGWIDTRARQADLAVAIRTFTVHGEGDDGCTRLGVGAGIVADSQPAAEWDETRLKAARLLAAAGAGTPALVGA